MPVGKDPYNRKIKKLFKYMMNPQEGNISKIIRSCTVFSIMVGYFWRLIKILIELTSVEKEHSAKKQGKSTWRRVFMADAK